MSEIKCPLIEQRNTSAMFTARDDSVNREDFKECPLANGIMYEKNGNKFWTLDGKRHRLDGPAVIWLDGDKSWYYNGQLHRLDGPAIERTNGHNEWYIEG